MGKIKILALLLCLIVTSSYIRPYKIKILKHKYYTTVFDENNKTPLYSYYTLYSKNLSNSSNIRTGFHLDKLEPISRQGTAWDYSHSKYDKGHLSPDDDFRFDSLAQSDAMVYTNCAFQVPSFNRGLWRSIENFTRSLARTYDSVIVTTGVIYSDTSKYFKTLPIPDFYYKEIQFSNQTICFLCRNTTYYNYNILDYQVSLDSIKKIQNYGQVL